MDIIQIPEDVLPEGIEGHEKKYLRDKDPEISQRTRNFVNRVFTEDEVRQMIASGKSKGMDVPLIIKHYPELKDMHQQIVDEFVQWRRKVKKMLDKL